MNHQRRSAHHQRNRQQNPRQPPLRDPKPCVFWPDFQSFLLDCLSYSCRTAVFRSSLYTVSVRWLLICTKTDPHNASVERMRWPHIRSNVAINGRLSTLKHLDYQPIVRCEHQTRSCCAIYLPDPHNFSRAFVLYRKNCRAGFPGVHPGKTAILSSN
jgi:hypothetical protein